MACSKSRRYRSARLGKIGNHKNRNVVKTFGSIAFLLISSCRQLGFETMALCAGQVEHLSYGIASSLTRS